MYTYIKYLWGIQIWKQLSLVGIVNYKQTWQYIHAHATRVSSSFNASKSKGLLNGKVYSLPIFSETIRCILDIISFSVVYVK